MGKKSGQQTSEVRLPPALEQAAEDNLAIANEVAAIGYTPYSGSTVAGFTPGQQAAFANTDQAAQAFNTPSIAPMGAMGGAPRDPLTGIPLSSMDANGDYNPFSVFQQALSNIHPRQRAMIESFVTDPQTGAWPANPAVPRPQFSPLPNSAMLPATMQPQTPAPDTSEPLGQYYHDYTPPPTPRAPGPVQRFPNSPTAATATPSKIRQEGQTLSPYEQWKMKHKRKRHASWSGGGP